MLKETDYDKLVKIVGECDLKPIIKSLAEFARDHLDLVRLSKNKFSKGWHGYEAVEDPELNLVQIEERITEMLVPTEKDKTGARYIKGILANLPVDQMGGFVADDTRSNPVKAFIDVLWRTRTPSWHVLLRRIWQMEVSSTSRFDMDPEAVLEIIRSQTTRTDTVNSYVICVMSV